MYTIVVSYTRNDHLYENFWETLGHVELPPSVIPPSHQTRTKYVMQALSSVAPLKRKRQDSEVPSSSSTKRPGRGLASPPLPETPTGRVWTRYTAPTGGSKLSKKKTVTSSLCHIIQQHTAVVRVVSSTGIGLSSTAVVVVVNFQSFGPSRPDRR